MLNHRPFEEWIFLGDQISSSEAASLRKHLDGCPTCRELAIGWARVESRLRRVTLAAPRPGFLQRWQSRRAALGHRRQRGDWWVLAASLTAAAAAAAVISAVGVGPLLQSPTAALYAWIRDLAVGSTLLHVGGDILEALGRTLPSGFLGGLWLAFVVGLGGLTVLWVASLSRISTQGVAR